MVGFVVMVIGFLFVKEAETLDREGYSWDFCWVVGGAGALIVLLGAAIGLSS